jgi:hypothetical protein
MIQKHKMLGRTEIFSCFQIPRQCYHRPFFRLHLTPVSVERSTMFQVRFTVITEAMLELHP